MTAGLVPLKHMSAAGLQASLKLITHLHKYTKPWIVSAPWRHTFWHMPVVSFLLKWYALINVRMVRDIAEDCAGTSMSLICRTPTFVPHSFWKAVPVFK